MDKKVKISIIALVVVIVAVIGIVMIRNNVENNKHITKLYAGGKFNKEKGVNTPKLVSGMTAIKWENGEVVEVSDPENDSSWYDYNNNKWANAITEDGSMWVWIPRYAYQIETGYHSDSAGTINIKFLVGTTNKVGEGKEPKYSEVSGEKNWMIHPAFTDTNGKLGIGWDTDIEGFWVAKFEAGRGEVSSALKYGTYRTRTNEEVNKYGETINYPIFKPNEVGINYMNSNDIYSISKKLVAVGNPYGLKDTEVESMQIKNTQWGAVAYLAQSSYGTNGKEIEINDVLLDETEDLATVKTGGENYKVNIEQSSTLNIYGVYDLVGGSWERVAGLLDNNTNLARTYYPQMIDDKDTKYVDTYIVKEEDEAWQNYDTNKDKYGDALWETSNGAEGEDSWNGDYSVMISGGAAVIRRGGSNEDGEKAGIFATYVTAGCETNANSSFRVVLVNK